MISHGLPFVAGMAFMLALAIYDGVYGPIRIRRKPRQNAPWGLGTVGSGTSRQPEGFSGLWRILDADPLTVESP